MLAALHEQVTSYFFRLDVDAVSSQPARTVFPAKKGPVNTHTSLKDTMADSFSRMVYIAAAVNMMPGYTVPPMTRPKGYHESESNQFQNS